jgi:hypothetical protein
MKISTLTTPGLDSGDSLEGQEHEGEEDCEESCEEEAGEEEEEVRLRVHPSVESVRCVVPV